MINISCNKLFLAAAFVFIIAEPLFGEARILEIAQNSSVVQRDQSNFNWDHDAAQLKAFVPTNAAPQLSTSPRYDVLAEMELFFADGELSSSSHKRLWPLSTSRSRLLLPQHVLTKFSTSRLRQLFGAF